MIKVAQQTAPQVRRQNTMAIAGHQRLSRTFTKKNEKNGFCPSWVSGKAQRVLIPV